MNTPQQSEHELHHSNAPSDVSDEALECIDRLREALRGLFEEQVDYLKAHDPLVDKAMQLIKQHTLSTLQEVKAKGPRNQSDLPTLHYFTENKERGWTAEQLKERRWGWDRANAQWLQAIESVEKEYE